MLQPFGSAAEADKPFLDILRRASIVARKSLSASSSFGYIWLVPVVLANARSVDVVVRLLAMTRVMIEKASASTSRSALECRTPAWRAELG